MRWLIPPVDLGVVRRLSRELGLSPLVARLLVRRGIQEPESADRFLRPSLDRLHDPFYMADMGVAIERLSRAIDRKEKILIYGDYDVDGTTGVVLLLTAFRKLGANVDAYIPNRLTEGYGMHVPVLEQAAARGMGVVLSVDTGIRDHEVIARARELRVDCIVTDHHVPDGLPLLAHATLNPRRSDCTYPDKNLSGAGVALKLAQALMGPSLSGRLLQSYLKIAAIGTIADVVPLVGENRVIAHFGLEGLRDAEARPGLAALLDVAGLGQRNIRAGDIAFRVAPRLNAAGRMESARNIIDLLTTSDPSKAREIAGQLDHLNRERQKVEEEILHDIEATVDQHPEKAEGYTLLFSGDGWHRGVIGIVAQRLADRYHRPTLVIGVQDGVGHGSGRSIPGFHLVHALGASNHLFTRYGGHAQAAGFTLPANHIQELEVRFEQYARAHLTRECLQHLLQVDSEIELEEIDWELNEQLRRFEPYGLGNPAPIFVARDLRLAEPPRVLKEKHLKLRVSQRREKAIDALGWGLATRGDEFAQGRRFDLAFTVEENVFQGLASLQLVIKDFQVKEVGSG